MPSVTAQESFRAMLKDHVSPALRAQGFQGSGGTYVRPSDSHWVLLGFQRSTSSDASAVKFTVNCKVVRRDVWDEMRQQVSYLGDKPTPTMSAGPFEWDRRLGELMPQGDDTWWWLRPEDDTARLAAEVIAAIQAYALPAMNAQVAETS
jgi:hypothetical protein